MPPTDEKGKELDITPAKKMFAHIEDARPEKKRRTSKTSAACTACKIRKTKCTGFPAPCRACKDFDTQCVIDVTLDRRRRTAVNRIMREAKTNQDVLRDIVSVLRRGDWTEIQSLIEQVQRSNEEEDLVEALGNRYYGIADNRNAEQEIKDVQNSAVVLKPEGQDGAEMSRTRFNPADTASEHSLGYATDSSTSIDNRSHRVAGSESKMESLAATYLSLISRLKTASDWEATCLLHTFAMSPLHGEIRALSEGKPAPPRLDEIIQPQQLSHSTSKIESSPANRSGWHPTLQLASLDIPALVSQKRSQELWNDRRSSNIPHATFAPHTTQVPGHVLMSTLHNRTLAMSPFARAGLAAEPAQETQTPSATKNRTTDDENSRTVELFGDLQATAGKSSPQAQYLLPDFLNRGSTAIPIHLIQPRFLLETSPLSKALTDFRDVAREMITNGTPAGDIINGTQVTVDLLYRDRWPSDQYTCSSWACELLRNFDQMDEIVRVGWVFLLTRLMRWMVFPTAETYADIPESQRPTLTQCLVPHMPALDLHPIPAMRDMLCKNSIDWVTPLASIGMSCNWPFTMAEVLDINQASGSTTISKAFGSHVAHGENWSVNAHGKILHPELAGERLAPSMTTC